MRAYVESEGRAEPGTPVGRRCVIANDRSDLDLDLGWPAGRPAGRLAGWLAGSLRGSDLVLVDLACCRRPTATGLCRFPAEGGRTDPRDISLKQNELPMQNVK